MQRLKLGGYVLGVGFLTVFAGCITSDGSSPPHNGRFTEDSLEYKVATVDAGAPAELDGPKVARVAAVLDKMAVTFKDSRTQICDECVEAHKLMVEKGVTNESIVEIMEHVESSIPENQKGFRLAGVLSTYVLLRTGK